MALISDYATLAELKAYLVISDTTDDVQLADAITSASRAIDQVANRHFGQADPATARYYDASRPSATNGFNGRASIETGDISTTTSLTVKTDLDDDGTFETTLTINTDFRLYPWNASDESRPWNRIVLSSSQSFPTQLRGVEVTAKWGWASVPVPIKNACLIQAGTIFKGGRYSPLGIAGSPDLGNELRLSTKLHPMAAEIVNHYKHVTGFS